MYFTSLSFLFVATGLFLMNKDIQ